MLFRRIWTHSRTYKRRKNHVADALSRLDLTQKQHDMIMDTNNPPQMSYVNQTDIDEVLEEVFPMSPKEMKKYQRTDKKLLKSLRENSHCQLKKVEDLVHYKDKNMCTRFFKELSHRIVPCIPSASRFNKNYKYNTNPHALAQHQKRC